MKNSSKPLTIYTDNVGFKFRFYPETIDVDVDQLKGKRIKVALTFECDSDPEIKSETIKLLRYQNNLIKQAIEAIQKEAKELEGNPNIITWDEVIKCAKRKASFDELYELNKDYPDM